MAFAGGCDSEEYILTRSNYHPPGWTVFESPDFHGFEGLAKGIRDCSKCHGNDLNGGIAEESCFECHGNGKDDCAACHGGLDDSTGAPPYGLRGEIGDTTVAVGAHSSHMNGSTITDGVGCESCHTLPASPWDSAHFDFVLNEGPGTIDSIAEVTWGGIAATEGGIWDRETKTCAGTYCHGNFFNGHTDNKPIWTGASQAECGSCHDAGSNPRELGRNHLFHVLLGFGCERCHAATVDSSLNIIGPEFHVNGEKTIRFSPDVGTFSDSSCNNPGECHDTQEWYDWY